MKISCLKIVLLSTALLLLGPSLEARVFQLKGESFATYLKGQYGMALEKDSPFAPSSGTGTVFSDEYAANLSYEFGFVYATTWLNWRFGFEVIKPTDLRDIKGTNAAGTTLYTATNSISGYVPKMGLEINLKQWNESRLFAIGSYGLATVTVQNSYTFTTAGTAAYPTPGADFREEVQGTGALSEGALGFETLLSDSATIVLEAGYRNLEVGSFKHNVAVKTFQGDVAKGDAAKTTLGGDRSLSLSGAYGSLMLRFWIK